MNKRLPDSSSTAKHRPLRIAYVAGSRNPARFREDPAFIYRCENPGLALKADGHQVCWLHWTALRPAVSFDLIVFHRPRWSLRWQLLQWRLRRSGITLVADIDDLVFDAELAGLNPGVLNSQVSRRSICRLYASHRRALTQFSHITVSTEPLAEEARSRFTHARVAILPNAVHYTWPGTPDPVATARAEKIITYFPGTRSHDRDFAAVAPALERFLADYPHVRLVVTGPLNFNLQARPGQVEHQPKVPFADYASLFAGAWVNLAPLEPTPFNRCKSALKILEAGYWNVPTICSPTPDNDRFAGAGALQAGTTEDWYRHLKALLDPACYREATCDLRRRVLQRAEVGAVAAGFLRSLNARADDGGHRF